MTEADEYGNTPLMIALAESSSAKIKKCIEEEKDFDRQNVNGANALMIAIQHGKNINAILSKTLDLKAKNSNGLTALQLAIISRRTSTAKEILKRDPETARISDKDGNTPIMTACFCGNKSIIVALAKIGVDTKAKNNKGLTIVDAVGLGSNPKLTDMVIFIWQSGKWGPDFGKFSGEY